jgi:hypothetical protein
MQRIPRQDHPEGPHRCRFLCTRVAGGNIMKVYVKTFLGVGKPLSQLRASALNSTKNMHRAPRLPKASNAAESDEYPKGKVTMPARSREYRRPSPQK